MGGWVETDGDATEIDVQIENRESGILIIDELSSTLCGRWIKARLFTATKLNGLSTATKLNGLSTATKLNGLSTATKLNEL